MKLSHLKDLCYRAHAHTSFRPEKRAEYYVKAYSEMLEEDLKKLGENTGNYEAKFIERFSDWMHAKSRCISSMITGPANFPVRRAQKANRAEENKYQDFMYWREKYFKAVNRVPTKSPEDEIVHAEKKLKNAIQLQDWLKEFNKEIRKSKLNTAQDDFPRLVDYLREKEYSAQEIKTFVEWRGGKWKIPQFFLTNNNATIKRLESKLKTMEARIERKNNWEDINFNGGYVTIEDDRVKIYHDEKPEREIIQEIKKSGFRWSPNWKCWCRKHTGNAIWVMKQLSFIKDVA